MIFDFGTQTLTKHARDESRLFMVVNRALAYKWSGENSKAKSIISNEDWSASRARFRLAEAIIMDNFNDAYKFMKEIGKNRAEVGKENYRGWPLFKEIKKEAKFLEIFQEIFGEPYNKIEEPAADSPANLSSGDILSATGELSEPTQNDAS